MLRILLISLFASVAFADTDKCEEARSECFISCHDYRSMPQNAPEYDAFCNATKILYECLLEAVSQCGGNVDEIAHYRETFVVLKHSCDKESELYSNLVLVLPCLTEEVLKKKNYKCLTMSEEESSIEKFEKILNNAGITDVGRDHECFATYFYDACAIASNGAICGEVARDVALEIIDLQIEERQDECSTKIKGKPTFSVMAPEMEILYLVSEAAEGDADAESEGNADAESEGNADDGDGEAVLKDILDAIEDK